VPASPVRLTHKKAWKAHSSHMRVAPAFDRVPPGDGVSSQLVVATQASANINFDRVPSAVSVSSHSPMLPAGSGVRAGDGHDNRQQATRKRIGLNSRRRPAPSESSAESCPQIDDGVEKSLERMARKSFISDFLFPELQTLLQLPPEEAKQAYLGVMNQYGVAAMLALAALLGSALNLLDPGDFAPEKSGLVLAFNTLVCIICIGSQCGACIAIINAVVLEATPATQIYPLIARGDGVVGFVVFNCALGLQLTQWLVVIRFWISTPSENYVQTSLAIFLTVMSVLQWGFMNGLFFGYLQRTNPVQAQLWTKLFTPFQWKREECSKAIDTFITTVRQQRSCMTITSEELSTALNEYLEDCQDVLQADESDFISYLEQVKGGRLSSASVRLARRAVSHFLDGMLEDLATQVVGNVQVPAKWR